MCRRLADRGYEVARQMCVADDGASIQPAAREALARSDLVLTTGGLGPTSKEQPHARSDRPAARPPTGVGCGRFGAHRRIFRATQARPAAPRQGPGRGPCPARAFCQICTAPRRASGHRNPSQSLSPGRAPKLAHPPAGPPRELRPMFSELVLPLVLKEFPLARPFVCRILRTTGLGESANRKKKSPDRCNRSWLRDWNWAIARASAKWMCALSRAAKAPPPLSVKPKELSASCWAGLFLRSITPPWSQP